MGTWCIIFVSLCLCMLIIIIRALRSHHLPPGPLHLPIISNILFLLKPFSQLEPILRNLHAKHGPIITLYLWSGLNIFIADRSLAYQALIQNGSVFANRPNFLSNKNITNDQLNISSSAYGTTWRVLRRNLASVMLHPARFRSFSGIRKRVLDDLLNLFKSEAESNHSVIKVRDHIQHAIFCLLVFMCFGESVDEERIKNIKHLQRLLILGFRRFSVLNFLPKVISRLLFRKRWQELVHLRKAQRDALVQLIEARKKGIENRLRSRNTENSDLNERVICYVDTLLNLQLPEENRQLDESEVVTLCSEFLTAGTDTTSTALEWVMANVVKYRDVKRRLMEEIGRVMGDREGKEVKEEDLKKLPYLKATILEGLRRHPPTHFVVPHAVTKDVVLDGYLIPKKGAVNFMVAEMGWDPRVWEDPMAFKPERFLGIESEGFDIRGNKEIKMMPFGAGKRMCPAYNLAMLHLEYFVANLVWKFEWKAPNGGDIDLSGKQEFTMVMKHPLQAQIHDRICDHLS
ncbi:hypothetical protein VNO77_04067 [Canavalia gladiata]|uniref:Cytochrome P450 n=1 Tax=Canavalia gladiata TaxID=3824 RepID=A0AAN9R7F4_CANGL